MSEDPFHLSRFVSAQDGVYDSALSELRNGHKVSHWMWFVFPQLAGLGRSSMAQRYAISGLDEARAYLSHRVLGPRLRDCASILLSLATSDAVSVFGSIDAMKLHSSMTLFALAAPDNAEFREVLEKYFGGVLDTSTTDLLPSPDLP